MAETETTDWKTQYEALEKVHQDTLDELEALKDMIRADEPTQDLLVSKADALTEIAGGLEARKVTIGAMDLSEQEKSALRAEYQRQIEQVNTQKETLQSYITKEA